MPEFTGRFVTNLPAHTPPGVEDALKRDLAGYHPAFDVSPAQRLEVVVSYPAETLSQALVTGSSVVEVALQHASLGADLVAAEVLPREDFDAGVGIEPRRGLLSVTEAARLLGVSGARVRQLLEAGQLAGTKVGATWVVERSAVQTRITGADARG